MAPKNIWVLRKCRDRIPAMKNEDFPIRFIKGKSIYVINVTKAGNVVMTKESPVPQE